jgi:ABC-type lipoprotein release transport system permease subunit
MVVTAVAALIFLSALAVGVEDAMLRNTVGLFSGHVTGYDLPESIQTEDLMVQGVETVLKRVYLPGVLSRGGSAQPLVLCAIDPVREADKTALKKKIREGRYPLPDQAEILISRDVSETLGVRIGDRLRFLFQPAANSVELSVSGIYHTGLDALDREMAFSPLKMIPGEGFPWTAAVFLKSGVTADTLLDTFRQHWPDRVRFESWETQMPDLRQLIDLETVSMMIVIILFFGVVAIGVACSFVIFIIRNMREYGIMRAMGVTTTEMSSLIVAKVTLMNLVACSVGLLIGMLAVLVVAHAGGIDISAFTSHNRYFAVSGVITPRLTAFSLWAPPATSLLFSLLAAAWPAVMVARKKAADILRLI